MAKKDEVSPALKPKIFVENKKTGEKVQRRLTEKERLKVVATYVETGELRATGRKHGITARAVRYIVDNSPEFAAEYQKRRQAEAEEVFTHMSLHYSDLKQFIDNYFDQLKKPELMERMCKSNMVGATVVLGTLLDKVAMVNKFAVDKGDNGDTTLNVQIVRRSRDDVVDERLYDDDDDE